MPYARGLRAGEGVTGNEPRVAHLARDRMLGGAHIADERAWGSVRKRGGERLGERADGGGDEHHLGIHHRRRDLVVRLIDRTAPQRPLEHVAVGVPAADARARAGARRQTDRAPDQADAEDRHLQRQPPREAAGRTLPTGVGRPAIRRR